MQTLQVGRNSYTVEPSEKSYMLHGPKGALYGLVRTHDNPHHLFAVNLNSASGFKIVKGFWVFENEDGSLKAGC